MSITIGARNRAGHRRGEAKRRAWVLVVLAGVPAAALGWGVGRWVGGDGWLVGSGGTVLACVWAASTVAAVWAAGRWARSETVEATRAAGLSHAALAELGQLALTLPELVALDDRAVRLAADRLDVKYCKVLRAEPGEGHMRLSAAVGWPAELVGRATVALDGTTQAGRTAISGMAMVADAGSGNGPVRACIEVPEELGAAMSMPIAVGGTIFGVLSAFSTEARAFSAAELQFLQSVANILAIASERKRAEGELRRREAEYRKLSLVASHTDNAVVITDPRGTLEWCNDAFERITERSLDELRGARLGPILQGPETDPETAKLLRQSVARGESFRVELINYNRSGTPYWVMIDAKPIHNELGEVVRFVAIERDITDRKRTEIALRVRTAELRTMQDASPIGIFGCDARGMLVEANRTFETITGVPSSTALGDGWLAAVHEADVPALSARWAEARKLGVAMGAQVRLVRRDGTTVWVSFKAAPVHDGSRVSGFVGTLEDITARVHAEQAAAVAAERYRAAAAGSLDALYLMEAVRGSDGGGIQDFVFVDVNQRGAEMLALPREAIVGQRMCELVPASRAAGFVQQYAQVMETGEVLEDEITIAAGPGSRQVRRQVVPLGSGVAVTSRDVTAQHEADAALRSLNRQLADKNADLEQFVYTVSHDLKSPLVTIAGFLGHLRRDLGTAEPAKLDVFAARIAQATAKMRETIDDLLELSRIGRDPEQTRVVDVKELVKELAADYADTLSAKQARLIIQPGLPLLTIDAGRLREVLDNLIGNAIKYACDRPDARVEVGCLRPPTQGRAAPEVRLFVRDEGPGIDPAYHERVFGLFQRVDTTKDGTGIGLAIVRRLAALYGGRAWVESEPGQGATFVVSFPASLLAEEPLACAGEPKPLAGETVGGRDAPVAATDGFKEYR